MPPSGSQSQRGPVRPLSRWTGPRSTLWIERTPAAPPGSRLTDGPPPAPDSWALWASPGLVRQSGYGGPRSEGRTPVKRRVGVRCFRGRANLALWAPRGRRARQEGRAREAPAGARTSDSAVVAVVAGPSTRPAAQRTDSTPPSQTLAPGERGPGCLTASIEWVPIAQAMWGTVRRQSGPAVAQGAAHCSRMPVAPRPGRHPLEDCDPEHVRR
jgi:hypothetical protein